LTTNKETCELAIGPDFLKTLPPAGTLEFGAYPALP